MVGVVSQTSKLKFTGLCDLITSYYYDELRPDSPGINFYVRNFNDII